MQCKCYKANCTIKWIVIYLVYSIIHLLNNLGQVVTTVCTSKILTQPMNPGLSSKKNLKSNFPHRGLSWCPMKKS